MDKDLIEKVAERIKSLRKTKKFTQDDLAYYSNIPRSTLGNIENVKNDITLSKINKIAKGLGVSLGEFFKNFN